MLILQTLGRLSLTQDDRPINVGNLKAMLCLVYLRHHAGRQIPRSELTSILWGTDQTKQARHSLSQCLYNLRRSLPQLRIAAAADGLNLEPEGFHYDVDDLRHATRNNLFAMAAEVYGGRFLQDLRTVPSVELEHWIDSVDRATVFDVSSAYRQLLRLAENSGSWRDVELWSDRILDLEPLDEEAHAYRIRATAALKGIEAASRLARDVRAQFAADSVGIQGQELGRTCDRFADADSVAIGAPQSPHEPTLRGRLNDFHVLTDSWSKADAEASQLVLVTGVAGIGKTRLSTHLLKWAAIRGSRVLTAKASHSDTHMSYAVVSQLLRSGIRRTDLHGIARPWRNWLGTLLPEHSLERFEGVYEPPLQREIFETVAQLLMPLADRAPLVLFVDDADLCDDLSAWLLHFLVQRLNSTKLLVVLASRSTAKALPAQLRQLVDSIDDSRLTRVQLGPIDDQSAVQLAKDIVVHARHDLASTESDDIVDYAKGVPYFVIEAAASIAFRANEPSVGAPVTSGGYSVLSTVRMLPAVSLNTIQSLAVLGFRAPSSLVRKTSSLTQQEYGNALAYLRSKRLVRETGRYVEFEHDIVREAVLADLSELSARDLNRRAALSLAGTTAAPPGLLAMHYAAAGLSGHAYSAAMLAAEEARKLRACSDVEFYLRLAIAKSTTLAERLVATAALIEHLCEFELFYEARRTLSSSPQKAVAHLQPFTLQLLSLYGALSDASLTAEEFLIILVPVLQESGKERDSQTRLRLIRAAIGLAHSMGSPIVGEILRPLINQLDTLDNSPEASKLVACLARTWAIYEGGKTAQWLANHAIEIAVQTGDKSALILGLIARGTVHMLSGNLRDAEADFDESTGHVQEPGFVGYSDRLAINRAVLLIETLRAAEGAESLERIVGSLALPDQLLVRGNLTLTALELGDHDRLLRRIRDLRNTNSSLQVRWAELFADCMEAYLFLATGREDDAWTIAARLAAEEERRQDAFGPDTSYAEVLIAKWKSRTSVSSAFSYISRSAVRHSRRNVLGELRLQLERARILMQVDPETGRSELERVKLHCRSAGALTLMEHAARCETAD